MTGSGFAPGEPVTVSLGRTPVPKSVLTADAVEPQAVKIRHGRRAGGFDGSGARG